ncbi:MAG: molecular chaperone HtpG [Planctomycetes bacterium]|nr:molecular chaperone HtpG [Planctomycetota bacterium]
MSDKQEFTFQTEIKQLLNILSHSLYQNREIAIRELISNASDSLNKLRHIQLSEEQYRDDVPLQITLEPDKDAKVLVIRDSGIGLTHDELVQNLGTIAHSGSKEFLRSIAAKEKPEGSPDLSLIGQFGVGFYSAFMLAEKVEVVTRSYRETHGWRWESDGTGRFTITAVEGDVPRGAQIRLHLKEEMEEFTEPERLKFIIRKYSTFVPHAIKLADETLNEQKPIWVEPKTQVTAEQYEGFYQWLTHHSEEKPLWHMHLSTDSPIQFHSILYCPPSNFELLGFGQIQHGVNLCAKRVLVQDDSQDLLPDYLRFLYGVVDSADLPLNVSRETLQDHKLLPKLKKVLTKKVLDHLADLSQEQPETFKTFATQFGSILRTGIGSDFENRERIAKLMRFHSTFSSGESSLLTGGLEANAPTPSVSLDDYLKRAPEGQSQIYYLSGPNLDAMQKHPHLEIFRKRNLEVLFLDDAIDEYALIQLRSYEGKDVMSIDGADVKFPESTNPADDPDAKKAPANFTRVVELFRGALDDKVSDVKESSRLTDSPCCLINPRSHMSSRLQQVLGQTIREFEQTKRVMEVNPHAALVERLCALSANSDNDEFIRDCGRQLYANAQILDGLIPDVEDTTSRSLRFMEELARSKSAIVV